MLFAKNVQVKLLGIQKKEAIPGQVEILIRQSLKGKKRTIGTLDSKKDKKKEKEKKEAEGEESQGDKTSF